MLAAFPAGDMSVAGGKHLPRRRARLLRSTPNNWRMRAKRSRSCGPAQTKQRTARRIILDLSPNSAPNPETQSSARPDTASTAITLDGEFADLGCRWLAAPPGGLGSAMRAAVARGQSGAVRRSFANQSSGDGFCRQGRLYNHAFAGLAGGEIRQVPGQPRLPVNRQPSHRIRRVQWENP